jgi:DNA-binding response OmpR family regulator
LDEQMSESRGLVVVVEDEPAIADIERIYLVDAGFSVHVARDGVDGLAAIRSLRPVAALVDIGLPRLDGIDLCRALRAGDDWTPIVFVTARDSEVDRILGLELGADDYVTKPFSARELAARVKGLVRRSQVSNRGVALTVGELRVDPRTRTVLLGGDRVDLTATEFDLLAYLMASPGQVFERSQLISAVWGVADYRGSRTVDVHVAQLRAKLGDGLPLRTIRGVGYALDEPPAAASHAAPPTEAAAAPAAAPEAAPVPAQAPAAVDPAPPAPADPAPPAAPTGTPCTASAALPSPPASSSRP